MSIKYNIGWNIIGVFEEKNVSILPNYIQNTLYEFNQSYLLTTILLPGKGYWIKFSKETEILIDDLGPYNEVIELSLNLGWNLICSNLKILIYLNNLYELNDIILNNSLYEYDNKYKLSNKLLVGRGYWIKSNTTKNITINYTKYRLYSNLFKNNYYDLINSNTIEELNINGIEVFMTNLYKNISENKEDELIIINGNGIPNYKPRIIGFDVTNGWNNIANNNSFTELNFNENSGGNNPNQLDIQNEIFNISYYPEENLSGPTNTTLGTVGVALNGIPIFNPFEDQNETSAYGRIFSGCCGHPQINGIYHYHKYPTCLKLLNNIWKSEKDKCDEIDQLVIDGNQSPLIGFANDGYPVYGPVGYLTDEDFKKKNSIIFKSSYTGPNDNNGNPTYIQNSGDLDDCNGINSPTPEFPRGTYHYIMTISSINGELVERYINPYFGYDIRNTLKKYKKMPISWENNDINYFNSLLNGFMIDEINIPGIANNTYNDFINDLIKILKKNNLSNIADEFQTMKIAYPYTILKYKGIVNNNGNGNTNMIVSPDIFIIGNTYNEINITLSNNSPMPIPPSFVIPNNILIGNISASYISRTDNTVICSLIIPTNTNPGQKDVIVQFPGPGGSTGPTYQENNIVEFIK
jgi:hypothetical protein